MLRSFNARISALFVLLLAGLGVVFSVLTVRGLQMYINETEQKLNMNLAEHLADAFEPYLRDGLDEAAIDSTIRRLMIINPRLEIYLLEGDGAIKAAFPEGPLAHAAVDLEPIRALQSGATLPVLGTDPLHPTQRKPFSVSPVRIMDDTDCMLYVILGGRQYDSAAGMVLDSYIVRSTLVGSGLTILLVGGVGLLLFSLLTRRLRSMKSSVRAFAQGDYGRRVEPETDDEIGELAAAFNRMATTIEAQVEALRGADRLRRELVANVSHDLRSPLASMQGYLETLLMKAETLAPEERERYTRTVLRNTNRLNRLVHDLFDLSRLDAGQVAPRREPFSLAELVQDIVVQFEPQADRQGIELRARLSDRLPPVEGDIGLVERAVSNLLDNALRYTPRGGHVEVVLRPAEASIEVSIQDNGPGIPAADLPHIFERFYRVEKSRTEGAGGTGLGLAIARRIVHLHGGRLEVESEAGSGARFWFHLPVQSTADRSDGGMGVAPVGGVAERTS